MPKADNDAWRGSGRKDRPISIVRWYKARRRCQRTLQTRESGSFSQCSFFQRKERALAQRSVRNSLGRKKSNGKNTFFLFPILSFSCKRKNGRRKKNAIQDRFALFHCAAFGGTYGGLLRNAACPVEIQRRAIRESPLRAKTYAQHNSGDGRGSPRSQSQIAPRLGYKRAPGSFA